MFHGFHLHSKKPQPEKKDTDYVSDYSNFMSHFLQEHPEAEKERQTGWALYWDRKVDLTAQEIAERDSVPDNMYGFYMNPRHDDAHPDTQGSLGTEPRNRGKR